MQSSLRKVLTAIAVLSRLGGAQETALEIGEWSCLIVTDGTGQAITDTSFRDKDVRTVYRRPLGTD